jgi:hypothetical protein
VTDVWGFYVPEFNLGTQLKKKQRVIGNKTQNNGKTKADRKEGSPRETLLTTF